MQRVAFRLPTLAFFTLALASSTLAAGNALAEAPPVVDDQTRSAARALTEQGLKLFDAGDYAKALDNLLRADELVRLPTTGLNLARTYAKLGKYVEASEKYLAIGKLSLDASAAPAQRKAQETAELERRAVVQKIASIEVVVDPPNSEAVVSLDGIVVPKALIGVARPTNPGSHRIEVVMGSERISKEISLLEGGSGRIVLPLPGTTKGPPVAVAAPTAPATEGPTPSAAAAPSASATGGPSVPATGVSTNAMPPAGEPQKFDEPRRSSWLTITGGILTGLGGAGLVTAGAFGLMTQSSVDELVACTDAPTCTRSDQVALHDTATSRQRNAFITLGVGAGLAATGVTLLVLGRKSNGATAPTTALVAGPYGGGALRIKW